MHVAQVTPYLYPWPGGIEFHVWKLAHKLISKNVDVSIHTSNKNYYGQKLKSYEQLSNGIEIYCYPELAAPLTNPIFPSVIQGIIKTQPDIIHSHGYFHFCSNMSAIASKISNIPLIINSHGFQDQLTKKSYGPLLIRSYLATLGHFSLKTAKYIIALHENDKEIIASCSVPREKIEIISNGVDLDELQANPSIHFFSYFNLPEDKLFILYIGRLIE